MSAVVEQLLLSHIIHEWRTLRADGLSDNHPDGPWPWGAWICLNDPLLTNHHHRAEEAGIRTPIHRVWFLDESGLHERNPWAFLRFWTVQLERPWCAPGFYVQDSAFARPRWRIGWAAFAEYTCTDDVYLEAHWGGLWARGQRVTVRDGTVRELSDIWVA
jgi:hypothetical protein